MCLGQIWVGFRRGLHPRPFLTAPNRRDPRPEASDVVADNSVAAVVRRPRSEGERRLPRRGWGRDDSGHSSSPRPLSVDRDSRMCLHATTGRWDAACGRSSAARRYLLVRPHWGRERVWTRTSPATGCSGSRGWRGSRLQAARWVWLPQGVLELRCPLGITPSCMSARMGATRTMVIPGRTPREKSRPL